MRALQLYSRGYGVLRGSGSGKFAAAEELFRLAIREDPSFAAAHNMLGMSIYNQDTSRQPEEYLRHIERALELTERTTESDRLFIEGSYFSLTKQWAKAAAKYEALLDPTSCSPLRAEQPARVLCQAPPPAAHRVRSASGRRASERIRAASTRGPFPVGS